MKRYGKLIFLILVFFCFCIKLEKKDIHNATTTSEPETSMVIEITHSSEELTNNNKENITEASTEPNNEFVLEDYDHNLKFNKLQELFIELPTNLTAGDLDKIIKDNNLYFRKEDDRYKSYILYSIAYDERPYNSFGDFNGKHMDNNSIEECINISFEKETGDLEYFMYVKPLGPRFGATYSLYYNKGVFGNVRIICDAYTVEHLGGNYYSYDGRASDIEWVKSEYAVSVTYRDDDDVPPHLRGSSTQPGLVKCESAVEAMSRAIEPYTFDQSSSIEPTISTQ